MEEVCCRLITFDEEEGEWQKKKLTGLTCHINLVNKTKSDKKGHGRPSSKQNLKAHFLQIYVQEWDQCKCGIPKLTKGKRGGLYAHMATHYHRLFGYQDTSFSKAVVRDLGTGKWIPADPLHAAELEGLDMVAPQAKMNAWRKIRKEMTTVSIKLTGNGI